MTFICHPELVSGFWSCNCHPPRPVTLNLFQGLAHRKPLSHLTFGTVYVLCAKLTACHLRTPHTLLFFPPVQLKLLRSLRLRFAHNGGLERFRPSGFCLCKTPSGFTHLIVFSACAIKIAPFTSLALRSQRRLGTVSPFGLLPLQNPFRLHTPYCLVALSSLGLRSFSPINKHIPSLSL